MRSLIVILLLAVGPHASAQPTPDPPSAGEDEAHPSEAPPHEAPSAPDAVTSPPVGPYDGPAYQLEPEVEIPLLVIPAVLMLGWPLSDTLPPPHCAPLCSPEGLNALDKPAAGLYSAEWSTVSDIGVGLLLASAAVVPFIDEAPLDALNDLVVIAQAIAWAQALSVLTGMASQRPRPILYSESAPLEIRNAPSSALSFFSGHTSSAFAASTVLFQTLRRRHPDSALPWVALAIGDSIALLVAIGRVQAGRHFPTDVIAGALVGTSMGLLIPALHDQPIQIAPMALPDGAGVTVGGAF